jgi:signal transduction histidine kinase
VASLGRPRTWPTPLALLTLPSAPLMPAGTPPRSPPAEGSLAPVSSSLESTARSTPSSADDRAGATAPVDHMVGIYEDAEHLVAGVVELLEPGLAGDDGAIVVASPLHRAGILQQLRERGVDVDAAIASDRLVVEDAAELLRTFLREDGPDEERFTTGVTALLARAGAGDRRVRIFGEMVTLLWDEGDVAGAIALEDLWNDLLDGRLATLLCGYPADAFSSARSTDDFRAVCERHSEVVTATEPPADDDRERSRTVAMLEHERTVDRNRREDLEAQRTSLEDALAHLREATARRDELLAVIVHDIRSPATLITNALALVLEAGPELGWDDVRELLSTAHEAGERITRLSRDIVTSAEADAGSLTYDLRPLDLVRVVRDAITDVRAATGRHIDLHHDLDLPPALADEVRQRQVLGNLLGNAVKYSRTGSPISVSVTRAEERLEVRVTDAGPGIPASQQARLFRPYSRLDSARGVEGSGIGLHSAKLLTEGQGGSIWVESELGRGSTFAYTVLVVPGHDAR